MHDCVQDVCCNGMFVTVIVEGLDVGMATDVWDHEINIGFEHWNCRCLHGEGRTWDELLSPGSRNVQPYATYCLRLQYG